MSESLDLSPLLKTLTWCDWHGGPVLTATRPRMGETPSGPPAELQACAACREPRHLPADTDGTASTAADYCHWHEGPTSTAVLVNVIGYGRYGLCEYACAPCREQRALVPYDQLQQP